MLSSFTSNKKAEFFVVGAISIVVIFYFLSKLLAPYNMLDASKYYTGDEVYFFTNVYEKLEKAYNISYCEEVQQTFQTYKEFVEKVANDRGYHLAIDYTFLGCDVTGRIILESPRIRLERSFEFSKP